MRISLKLFGAVLCCALMFCAFEVQAAKAAAKTKTDEVILTSEGGMEWNGNKKTLTAEKRALVVRGDTALGADKIVAYYRETDGEKSDVYLVRAFGNVVITTPEQIIYADTAVYEIEQSVIILKGNPVKLFAGQEQMTAKIVELWQDQNVAIARQDVVAQKDARRLEADTVKAFFAKKDNKTEIERFEAEDNVIITNDNEKVEGDSGVYYVEKETATLQGNVKISQGTNYIVGEVADINMKTGVSRLQTPSEKGKARGQVRGVFVPESKKKGADAQVFEKPQKPAALKENGSVDGRETNEKLLSSSDERN